jgi:hypothetical protein
MSKMCLLLSLSVTLFTSTPSYKRRLLNHMMSLNVLHYDNTTSVFEIQASLGS